LASQEIEDAFGHMMLNHQHTYSVTGTWTSWASQDMRPVPGLDYMYDTTFRIGAYGREEFQLLRNRDGSQAMYPAATTASRTSLPVRGPDQGGKDKNWVVQGSVGDVITVRLRVRDGNITVTIISAERGERTWRSLRRLLTASAIS